MRVGLYIIIPTLHYSTSKTNPACATERKKKPVLPYVPRGLGRGRSTTDPVYFLLVFPSKSTCVSVLSSFRVGGEAAHTWKKRELEGGLDGGGLSLSLTCLLGHSSGRAAGAHTCLAIAPSLDPVTRE